MSAHAAAIAPRYGANRYRRGDEPRVVMTRAAGGEVERFCARVHPQLVGTLTVFCGDRGVAEELAQETLIRVWDRWDRVGGLQSPEGWAHRVAINLARSWWRRRGAERRAYARRGRADVVATDPDAVDRVAVRAAIGALPDRQRAVLALRFYAELSVAETAEVLGCAPGTVKSLTAKAKANLRDRHGLTREVIGGA